MAENTTLSGVGPFVKLYAASEIQEVVRALALESRMLEDPAGEEGLLFCWTGERAVVMGKNQNPWRECNLDFIREAECKLARRISGGGTVYHDPGNLNISWILPRDGYRAEQMHGLMCRALHALDIAAEVGNGGSLLVAGKKISGSAFCYRKDRVLHHGTLLVDANLGELRAALAHPKMQMETHAVDSVPAAVVNLKTLKPEINKTQIQESLVKEAEKVFGPLQKLETLPDIEKEVHQLSSDEWLWAQTPAFSGQLTLHDGREIAFKVRKGKMIECRVEGEQADLMVTPDFPAGDYAALEKGLAVDTGSVRELLMRNGWLKI
ncbi:hypothetical protein P0Y35_18200 [Kiritimatiellaeota bacterium B1221]|nr:hypothetical protein [Kiritimatiellaeota bacterium B1221]